MPKKEKAPAGAKVTTKDEVQEKLAAGKKSISLEEFHKSMKEQEKIQRKALSSDMQIVKGVTPPQVAEFQTAKRLRGWDPVTRTALVLKPEFMEKFKQ